MKIGLIGLDSSHVISWLEAAEAGGRRIEWVGAWGEASADMELSYGRIEGYTQQVRERWGVPVCGSLAEAVAGADAVIVAEVDARRRAEVVEGVLAVRAVPVFVDKPLALGGKVAERILAGARARGVGVMSCSCLRFVGSAVAGEVRARWGETGGVLHIRAPLLLEPTQGRYFWYGIHAVELLYACFGPG
jgi:predicted dehydrogenase